jgi:hypothetical protein
MRVFRLSAAFALVVAGVVSTVGCSDFSSFSDSASPSPIAQLSDIVPPPPPLDWVDITTDNAQDVSATVVRAADRVSDVAAVIGGQIFPSPPSAPDLLSSNSKFELFATVAATGEPVTETCAVSGTVTVSGEPENNPVSLSPSDRFDLLFDTCDDGDGYTLDGNFRLGVSEVVGDPRTDVFRLKYAIVELTLTIAAGTDNSSTSVGPISLEWDSVAFPVTVLTLIPTVEDMQLSYQADVYSWPYGGQSLTVNADMSISTTLSEALESLMKSAFLDGYVVYETIVALQAPDGQNPESGEILVRAGKGNGTIRIVIESSASVRLDIDSNGDSIVDDIQYTTWAALLG